jgi:hypothetical protein
MLLSERELAFVHVSLLVNTDALPMSHVFEPFSVILSLTGYFISQTILESFEPGTVVDIHICCAVFLRAQCSLPMTLVVHKLSIVGHLASIIKVITLTMAASLFQVSFVKVPCLVVYHYLHLFFTRALRGKSS